MSDFTVLVAGKNPAAAASPDGRRRRLDALARTYAAVYGAVDTIILGADDAAGCLIVNEAGYNIGRFEDARGWLAVKGVVFTGDAAAARPAPAALFAGLLADPEQWIRRLQGSFALAMWDAERRELLLLNDQASTLNLYFGTVDGDGLATTAIMPAAVTFGIAPDPHGVREHLARGGLLLPTTFFAGIERVNIGQNVRLNGGEWRRATHWQPFQDTAIYRNFNAAADAYTAALVRATDQSAPPNADLDLDTNANQQRHPHSGALIDLSGGYDTRMMVGAALRAGLNFDLITIPNRRGDPAVASRVAQAMGLRHHIFGPETRDGLGPNPQVVRELLYRTAGEWYFGFPAYWLISLKQLRPHYHIHLQGSAGELTRAHQWSHEFWDIGRVRPPNIDRMLRYRFFQQGRTPPGLYRRDWWPDFVSEFAARARNFFDEPDDARNTQRLDAFYFWRSSKNAALLSAIHGWMPTAHPMYTADVADVALAIPWQHKLNARLARAVTQRLSPELAALPTEYGGTAGPMRLSNLHLEARQALKHAHHLVSKVDRTIAGGMLTRIIGTGRWQHPNPYMPDALRPLLTPDAMFSKDLYDPAGLSAYLDNGDASWRHRVHLSRILNVELLFRECDFQPDAAFLDAAGLR